MKAREIKEKTLAIGDTGIAGPEIYLPTIRGELTEFHVFDASPESKAWLEKVNDDWDQLWPELESRLTEGIARYKTGQRIGGDEFGGFFDFSDEPGSFMDDESDYQIGFSFATDVPGWDAFIKGREMVHFQPIF